MHLIMRRKELAPFSRHNVMFPKLTDSEKFQLGTHDAKQKILDQILGICCYLDHF